MRISTTQIQLSSVQSILDQQSKLIEIQNKISTGKNILTPADDPAGAARVLGIKENIEVNGQYKRNADAAEARLEVEESALTSMINVFQKARELYLHGINGSLSQSDRGLVADELRQNLAEIIGLAGQQDANGDYLFSGYSVNQVPVNDDGVGGYTYDGDQGDRLIKIGPNRSIADSDNGFDLFFDIGVNTVNAAVANVTTAGSAAFTDVTLANGSGDTYSLAVGGLTIFSATEAGALITVAALDVDNAINDGLGGGLDANQDGTITVAESGGALTNDLIYTGTAAGGDLSFSDATGTAFNAVVVNDSGAGGFTDGGLVTGTTAATGGSVATTTAENAFSIIYNLAAGLDAGTQDSSNITDIDTVMDNLNSSRSAIGSRLNAIDSQRQINEDVVFQSQKLLSSIEDLDFAEAITTLNLKSTALEAAQQSYIRVQGLSLFNFL